MTMTLNKPSDAVWFDLSSDQKAILGPLREFLKAEVAPGAVERDKTGEFPHDLVKQLGQMGVLGMQVSEEHGGAALDTATMALIIEEIAAVDGSLCLTVASHNSLCTGHIQIGGSEAQHAEWLPELATGQKLGAWGLDRTGFRL